MKEAAEGEHKSNANTTISHLDERNQIEYAKRIGADTLLNGTKVEKKDKPIRRCSYCGISSHTRRTCLSLKAAMSNNLEESVEYRKEISKTMINMGFGVGSLVIMHPRYGDKDPKRNYLYMVKRIRWDLVTHITGLDGGRLVDLDCLDAVAEYQSDEDRFYSGSRHVVPLPPPEGRSSDNYGEAYFYATEYWKNMEMASPVSADTVHINIPDDFCEVENKDLIDSFKARLKEMTSEDYWKNYYNEPSHALE
jgi:hypothetical protein